MWPFIQPEKDKLLNALKQLENISQKLRPYEKLAHKKWNTERQDVLSRHGRYQELKEDVIFLRRNVIIPSENDPSTSFHIKQYSLIIAEYCLKIMEIFNLYQKFSPSSKAEYNYVIEAIEEESCASRKALGIAISIAEMDLKIRELMILRYKINSDIANSEAENSSPASITAEHARHFKSNIEELKIENANLKKVVADALKAEEKLEYIISRL